MMNILRKNIPFDNGLVNVSSFTVNYEEYDGFEDRGELHSFSTYAVQWYMVDRPTDIILTLGQCILLPYSNTSVTKQSLHRVSRYGLRKDTPEERQTRTQNTSIVFGGGGGLRT